MLSFNFENLLVYILIFPLIGILCIILVKEKALSKIFALNFSCLPFIGFLFIWIFFQKSLFNFQFVTKIFWLSNLNLNFTFGIDGISLVRMNSLR